MLQALGDNPHSSMAQGSFVFAKRVNNITYHPAAAIKMAEILILSETLSQTMIVTAQINALTIWTSVKNRNIFVEFFIYIFLKRKILLWFFKQMLGFVFCAKN
jgi:hypothetical protein